MIAFANSSQGVFKIVSSYQVFGVMFLVSKLRIAKFILT